MAGLVNLDIGGIFNVAREMISDYFPSAKEKAEIKFKDKALDASERSGQMAVNAVEAGHKSLFVAGWRPAIGWVGAIALAYKFIGYSLLIWIWSILKAFDLIPQELAPPPSVNAAELYPIILGMLGLGGMRTLEGIKKVKTNTIAQPTSKPKKKHWWSSS